MDPPDHVPQRHPAPGKESTSRRGPGGDVPDGTGDFESASRGGPAVDPNAVQTAQHWA